MRIFKKSLLHILVCVVILTKLWIESNAFEKGKKKTQFKLQHPVKENGNNLIFQTNWFEIYQCSWGKHLLKTICKVSNAYANYVGNSILDVFNG